MNITLPKKLNSQKEHSIDFKNIVIVGANGSGKTRFGTYIEERYNKKTHRISAQKSLSMPTMVSPISKKQAEAELLYGNYQEKNPASSVTYKKSHRWGNNPNTHLLSDYHRLMVFLFTEETEEAIKFKDEYKQGQVTEAPITKLDKIQNVWESILPNRKLVKRMGMIEAFPTENSDNRYNASEMSDGERVIFYLIGEIISAPENSIIVIDEPEMHIHKSVTKKLWDKIEEERTDCSFIYLTHDIDFACSRQEATKIWMKEFDGTAWDYEILEDNSELPEQLYLEVLGSRKPILFIEGEKTRIDHKLLQLIFPEHTIKSLGGCQKVIEITKSFNQQKEFHNIEAFGIIDRDRRKDEEVEAVKKHNIWVTMVAEIENFLLLEEIIKIVAKNMMKNPDDIFKSVKENVISFFRKESERQALEHTNVRIERIFKQLIDSSTVKTIDKLEDNLSEFWKKQNFRDIYDKIKAEFDELVKVEDYNTILKVFNNKGLIANSSVASLCDLNTKNDTYLNYIIGILKQNNEDAKIIKQSIINKIEKNII